MNSRVPVKYDAFISYRHAAPDGPWVHRVLVPALEQVGVRICVDTRDFRLGAALVEEMERAVTESRYTLAILTPSYLESHFTKLETVLAEHLGLEEGARRLVGVIREPCHPRLSLRAHLSLDMTSDALFAANIERLVDRVQSAI